jgi:3-keto-L-gulonate-6-phosphate decarboxylase
MQNQQLKNKITLFAIVAFILFIINPLLLIVYIIILISYFNKNKQKFSIIKDISNMPLKNNFQKLQTEFEEDMIEDDISDNKIVFSNTEDLANTIPNRILNTSFKQTRLEKRKKYLHIALNNSIEEARSIIRLLPSSERILVEVGTPMIKRYGTDAIEQIKGLVNPGTYIVADNKCSDLAPREVEMMATAGANAATCLGVAPTETIDSFIEECTKFNIDSMIDMMNVEDSLAVLKKLKKLPDVVILHRGVDETEITKGKQIPLYQIKQIKGNYNILVAVAGGDTLKEIQSALFNDADIVVVWKNFYQASGDTAQLAKDFLKEIK